MDDAAATAATAAENQAVRSSQDETRPPAQRALVEEAARVAATLNDKLPTLSGESPASANHQAAPEREPAAAREAASGAPAAAAPSFGREEGVGEPAAAHTAATQAETRGRMRQRAATVGASVGENLRPRVEKLREASTVVFDEATDDPGLRFIIIAVVLFLIFLLIFLFSYILG
jgi:hypothetical protein